MEIAHYRNTLLVWQHNCESGQYSAAQMHGILSENNNGRFDLANLTGLAPENIDGF